MTFSQSSIFLRHNFSVRSESEGVKVFYIDKESVMSNLCAGNLGHSRTSSTACISLRSSKNGLHKFALNALKETVRGSRDIF